MDFDFFNQISRMKKAMPVLVLLTCFMLAGLSLKAQYVLKQADQQYEFFNYSKAIDLYLEAYKKKETLYTAERLAACYAFIQDYKNTEIWYQKALAMPGSKTGDILKYAKALQSNAKYEDAKMQFLRYYDLCDYHEKTQVKLWAISCDSALKWTSNPTEVEIKNEKALNGPQSDWGAINFNNSVVFTSDRITGAEEAAAKTKRPFLWFDHKNTLDKRQYGWTGNGYLKLYIMQKGSNQRDSVTLFPIDAGTDYHIGKASFTADNSEMYFTVTRLTKRSPADTGKIRTIDLEIFSSKRDPVTNRWTKPVPFKYNNAGVWSVGDPFISPDGKKLYFTADYSWGQGGTDIYYCIKDENGAWAKPVNLREVNTIGNERTPILDSVGNLYFSSDGGIGMGGLDIFKAVKNRKTFYPPKNLEYPINSSHDDFAYTPESNTTGFFASNRDGGAGDDDIYSYIQAPSSVPVNLGPLHFAVEGVVYDTLTRKPLPHSIVTLSRVLAVDQVVETGIDGHYYFDLRQNMDFNLNAQNPGYLTVNGTVTTKGLLTSKTLHRDFYLRKIELNKAIRIENIYYDFDKANIRPDAAVELNKLIKIMKDNPTIQIELGSHTDSRGSDGYNMLLSQLRANSAVLYLITVGGIDKSRLTARGYGETRLLNRCSNGVDCSPAEHQLNRRTEFKIVKM